MKYIHTHLTTLTLASVLGVVTSASALAAPTASDFKKYDGNSDGTVSQQEYQAKGGSEETFRMIDANGDGSLSHDEFVKKSATSAPSAAPGNSEAPDMPNSNGRL